LSGYILRITPYKEGDAIARLYDDKHGKCSVYLHRYKRSSAKFPSPIQYFTRYDFELKASGGEFYKLGSAYIEDSHPKISELIERYAAASSALELLDALLPDEHAVDGLGEILGDFYAILERTERPLLIALALTDFECRLQNALEILPNLEYCYLCSKKLGKHAFYKPGYSFSCEQCTAAERVRSEYPYASRAMQRLLSQTPAQVLSNARSSNESALRVSICAMRDILHDNALNHCHRRHFKARDFFENLFNAI
jgi:DNA repair protein RecO